MRSLPSCPAAVYDVVKVVPVEWCRPLTSLQCCWLGQMMLPYRYVVALELKSPNTKPLSADGTDASCVPPCIHTGEAKMPYDTGPAD